MELAGKKYIQNAPKIRSINQILQIDKEILNLKLIYTLFQQTDLKMDTDDIESTSTSSTMSSLNSLFSFTSPAVKKRNFFI